MKETTLSKAVHEFVKTNDNVAFAGALKQSFNLLLSESSEYNELLTKIQSYKLDESADLEFDEFKEPILAVFKKHFPNGFIGIEQQKSFGNDKEHINILMGMIGNPKDNTNGIIQNDPMRHTVLLYPNRDGVTYSFKGDGRIYIKKLPGSFNAMDSIKANLGSMTSTTLKKAQDKILKFIPKLADLMKDNIENIVHVENIDKKYLIVH